jgi:hypothetical protein
MLAAQALGELRAGEAASALTGAIRNEWRHWPTHHQEIVSLNTTNPMWQAQRDGVLHYLADALTKIKEPSIESLRDVLDDESIPGLHDMAPHIIRKIEKRMKRS